MTLKEQIDQDYIEAYKARNEAVVSVLRILKSDLKNTEIAQKSDLKDEDVIAIIKKQVKQRRDTIEIYKKSDKNEAALSEQKEINILNAYLPEQLGEDETRKLVETTINELGITDKSQMGKLIGAVMSKGVSGLDGGLVSKIANEILQNKN